MELVAKNGRESSYIMNKVNENDKDKCLLEVKRLLLLKMDDIMKSNKEDLDNSSSSSSSSSGLDQAMLSRLSLQNKDKFDGLLKGIDDVINKFKDPVGKIIFAKKIDEGLNLYKVACPIGVICVIFESRPEAVIQIASLTIKSGNALILKGGKEAAKSNQILSDVCCCCYYYIILFHIYYFYLDIS